MDTAETRILTEQEVLEIIGEILRGDNDSFEIIYDYYYKMVISIIRRIIKPNPSEVDALVNEAFLIIYKSLKGFKGNSKFSTYAYRIVLNYAFRVSKKKSRERRYFAVFGKDADSFENIASSEETENTSVDKNTLEQIIGSLSKDLQEAVDLYYYERYSIKEIADIVGTTDTAIKNRLYQARNKIKIELNKGALV